MKRLQKYSISNRTTNLKENRQRRSLYKKYESASKCEDLIDEWKLRTGQALFKQNANKPLAKKPLLLEKQNRRVLTQPDCAAISEPKISKISEIEMLKKHAQFLQIEFECKKRNTEILKAEPVNTVKIVPIRLDNWLSTVSNGFFKAEERHSVLQKKRNKIRNIKKGYFPIDNMDQSDFLLPSRNKIKEPSVETNKHPTVYPLADSIYQQQIKQRLKTPSTQAIHDLCVDGIRKSSFYKNSFRIETAKSRPASNFKMVGMRDRVKSQYFNL